MTSMVALRKQHKLYYAAAFLTSGGSRLALREPRCLLAPSSSSTFSSSSFLSTKGRASVFPCCSLASLTSSL